MKSAVQISRIQQAAAALILTILVTGCVSVPPLKRDKDYPADWPELSLVGPECAEIDGAYLNEGMVTAPGGAPERITLATLMPFRNMRLKNTKRETFEAAKVISLQVLAKKGSAFQRLDFGVEQDGVRQSGQAECFFGNGALMFIAESGAAALPIAFGVSQCNVWLTKAVDGSLIAKIEDSSAGMIFVVPFASSSSRWARFLPAKE